MAALAHTLSESHYMYMYMYMYMFVHVHVVIVDTVVNRPESIVLRLRKVRKAKRQRCMQRCGDRLTSTNHINVASFSESYSEPVPDWEPLNLYICTDN